MPERVFYEDPEIRITATEIRCPKQTIQTSAVTVVRFASVRPGKWLPVIALVPLLGVLLLYSQTKPTNLLLVVPLVLPIIPVLLLAFLRISRLTVQTTGGPVVLANKLQLTDPAATLARFQTIKDSIEQARRATSAN